MGMSGAGKGDDPRPFTDKKVFRTEFDRIMYEPHSFDAWLKEYNSLGHLSTNRSHYKMQYDIYLENVNNDVWKKSQVCKCHNWLGRLVE
jgi:hypothetical protein